MFFLNSSNTTKTNLTLPLVILMIIITLILITLLIIQIDKNQRKKRNRTIIFLTFLISSLFFITIGKGQLIYYPATKQQVKLNENVNYKIVTNENISNITITINFLTYVDFFEYDILFYDNKDNLIKADSNKLTNLTSQSYKTLNFDKPSKIVLNGGSYQFKYKCYNLYQTKAYLEDNQTITIPLIIGLVSSFISFVLIKIINNEEKESYINSDTSKNTNVQQPNFIYCINCGQKNPKQAKYCCNCGNHIVNPKEE